MAYDLSKNPEFIENYNKEQALKKAHEMDEIQKTQALRSLLMGIK